MSTVIDPAHFTTLAHLDPDEVGQRTGAVYNVRTAEYSLPVWNTEVTIRPATRSIATTCGVTLPEYLHLFTIQYLLSASLALPSSQWISEKDIPGGETFFRGPHAIPTHLICQKVADSLENFRALCEQHDGTEINMADAAYTFTITNRIPLGILYWEADEDFPAEARILYDATITHHLALDIIFALASGVCQKLGSQ